MRVQEAALKVLKARKKISVAAFTSEVVEILKSQFLPSKKLMKEQGRLLSLAVIFVIFRFICKPDEQFKNGLL